MYQMLRGRKLAQPKPQLLRPFERRTCRDDIASKGPVLHCDFLKDFVRRLPKNERKRTQLMKTMHQLFIATALLAFGFAFGFTLGKNAGFNIGSEWAIIQADIVAREAGMFMPVRLENGTFRVKLKQPRDLYQRVWRFADEHFEDLQSE
jgi:hypothetical protein